VTGPDDQIRSTLTAHDWTYHPSVAAEEIRRVGTGRRRRSALTRGLAVAGATVLAAGAVWVGLGAGANHDMPPTGRSTGPVRSDPSPE